MWGQKHRLLALYSQQSCSQCSLLCPKGQAACPVASCLACLSKLTLTEDQEGAGPHLFLLASNPPPEPRALFLTSVDILLLFVLKGC